VTDPSALDPEAAVLAIEYCYEQGWSDGLPVVPPTEARLREFLAQTARTPDEVIARAEHLGTEVTVQQAAVNAIMAGCLPKYFPVVLAGIEALWGGDKGVNPLLASTTGPVPLMILNGPIRNDLGVNCAGSVFGPGFRANATIGRALRLIIMNVIGLKPHELDQATQSTPAKYTFCFGENEEESPWEPLHVELGFRPEQSTVTGYMARGTMHVENRTTQDPELILNTIADAMSYGGAPHYFRKYPSLVVMGPEHANILARQGWSKAQVKMYLRENFGRTVGEMKRMGKGDFQETEPGSYTYVADAGQSRMPCAEVLDNSTFIHFAESPDDILLVVAGAFNAGVSTVVPALGLGQSAPWPIAEIITRY
jgi:hypothetical protein